MLMMMTMGMLLAVNECQAVCLLLHDTGMCTTDGKQRVVYLACVVLNSCLNIQCQLKGTRTDDLRCQSSVSFAYAHTGCLATLRGKVSRVCGWAVLCRWQLHPKYGLTPMKVTTLQCEYAMIALIQQRLSAIKCIHVFVDKTSIWNNEEQIHSVQQNRT